ncbi:hypothetical protein H2248_009944 [Termitomyces sp. 'cryptogamus']|nr:hypothetical protein H2248_009944 [Termitomyces sp. 'cryptogamus']
MRNDLRLKPPAVSRSAAICLSSKIGNGLLFENDKKGGGGEVCSSNNPHHLLSPKSLNIVYLDSHVRYHLCPLQRQLRRQLPLPLHPNLRMPEG